MSDCKTPVIASDAREFASSLQDESVHLLACDPPFYGIVSDEWDNQWNTLEEFAQWLYGVFVAFESKLTRDGSIVFFGGIGKHGHRALFRVMDLLESSSSPYTFRNMITWKKRRAYGKSHDYLFCREEILWYSRSSERTGVRFNIPLSDQKRGYAGFDPKYPAKSEYKRISNVWDDIPELMRPSRSCEKPVPLMRRIIDTHSMPGDLVVDCFAGTGATGVAAVEAGRMFTGCDSDATAANVACRRVLCADEACLAAGGSNA